jgi:predicted O-methyltransferase YrrM
MFDKEFLAITAPLLVPEMGTENVAPLLYWLLRIARPRRVLEVGMGYTTPFLLKALQDNIAAWTEERESIIRNSVGSPLGYRHYYDEPYDPKLVCVDRMNEPTSSASRVAKIVEALQLSGVCQVIEGDLRNSQKEVRGLLGVIDLAWVDTWDTLAFISDYWSAINPAGGILAVHWLMTYPQGRAVLQYIEALREVDGGSLEIVNFIEPHKVAQNSVTLIRRVRDYVDPEDLRPLSVTGE